MPYLFFITEWFFDRSLTESYGLAEMFLVVGVSYTTTLLKIPHALYCHQLPQNLK